MLQELKDDGEHLDREAIEPLEFLAGVVPLLEDVSRFVILYQRQEALAERLKSLTGADKGDDPKRKARMRDLQAEQEGIRQALTELLDQMEDHVTGLPDDPDMESLHQKALEFVEKVRGSGATEAMSEAESGLAEFSGDRGHEGARRAAAILKKFLDFTDNEGGIPGVGLAGLKLKPVLRNGLGDTISQLLGEAGLLPGKGKGSGGGLTASRSTLDNVGLYGGLPGMEDVASDGT